MQNSLRDSFKCCQEHDHKDYFKGSISSELAIDFISSGLTAVAKYYVKNRLEINCEQLEQIIYTLLSGKYLV